jgi:glycosyltransferase involved in cell wall biosynthesis
VVKIEDNATSVAKLGLRMSGATNEISVLTADFSPVVRTGQSAMLDLAISALRPGITVVNARPLSSLGFSRILAGIRAILQVARLSRLNRPSVFYYPHSRSLGGLIRDVVLVYCTSFRCKVVLHCHGGEIPHLEKKWAYRFLLKLLYLRSERWIFLNRRAVGRYLQILDDSSLSQKKIEILDNAIPDADTMKLLAEPKNTGDVQVLFLSNFLPEKGLEDFCDCASKFAEKKTGSTNVRFVAIGKYIDSASRTNIEKKFANLSNLQIIDNSTRDETLSIMSSSNIFLFPSRYRTECQPLTIIEALIAKLKIVSFNPNEILDQFDEFDVVRANSKTLFFKLNEQLALNEEDAWKKMREYDSDIAQERFSELVFSNKLREVIGL